ncbi:unnamed protein product, partial [Didymodactylos carnosus]
MYLRHDMANKYDMEMERRVSLDYQRQNTFVNVPVLGHVIGEANEVQQWVKEFNDKHRE